MRDRFSARVRAASVSTALIGWTLVVLLPFLAIILLSFRTNAQMFSPADILTAPLNPENYVAAWFGASGNSGMAVYLTNSAVVAMTAVLVALSLGVTSAYFGSYLTGRARTLFTGVFIAGLALPVVVLLVPFYQVFNAGGLLNLPVATGVLYGILATPTCALVMLAYYSDFPRELIEAATIDGLGPWASYLRIVLPLSRGAIAGVGMITLLFAWGETQLGVVLLQTPASQTVPVGLLTFQGQFNSDLGALFAGLSLAAVPVCIVYLVVSRQVAKGITLGGFGGR